MPFAQPMPTVARRAPFVRPRSRAPARSRGLRPPPPRRGLVCDCQEPCVDFCVRRRGAQEARARRAVTRFISRPREIPKEPSIKERHLSEGLVSREAGAVGIAGMLIGGVALWSVWFLATKPRSVR